MASSLPPSKKTKEAAFSGLNNQMHSLTFNKYKKHWRPLSSSKHPSITSPSNKVETQQTPTNFTKPLSTKHETAATLKRLRQNRASRCVRFKYPVQYHKIGLTANARTSATISAFDQVKRTEINIPNALRRTSNYMNQPVLLKCSYIPAMRPLSFVDGHKICSAQMQQVKRKSISGTASRESNTTTSDARSEASDTGLPPEDDGAPDGAATQNDEDDTTAATAGHYQLVYKEGPRNTRESTSSVASGDSKYSDSAVGQDKNTDDESLNYDDETFDEDDNDDAVYNASTNRPQTAFIRPPNKKAAASVSWAASPEHYRSSNKDQPIPISNIRQSNANARPQSVMGTRSSTRDDDYDFGDIQEEIN